MVTSSTLRWWGQRATEVVIVPEVDVCGAAQWSARRQWAFTVATGGPSTGGDRTP
jgi:hypothetical protein